MPRPTSDTAIQRPDLGQALYEVMTESPSMGYIGMKVMPPFYVGSNAAEYPVIPKEALFNLLDTKRGPLGHYNRFGWSFESGFYSTKENGLEAPLDERYRAMYANLFDQELATTKILMGNILRAWEYRVMNKLFVEANYKAAVAAGTAWSNVAATPKADVDTGKAALRLLGIVPNALVFNWTTFMNLQKNTEIKAHVTNMFRDEAKTGQVSIAHLQAYFDVEQIIVAGALYNNADLNQNANLTDIWSSTYALLGRVATPGSDIAEPCIGRTFIWNEGAREEVVVEQYWEEAVRAEVYRVRHDTDESLLASMDENKTAKSEISKAAGYLIDVTGN